MKRDAVCKHNTMEAYSMFWLHCDHFRHWKHSVYSAPVK